MFGTLVNVAAICAGGLVGLLLRGGLKERFRDIIMQGVALAVLFVGMSSALSNMLKPEANPILFIISLALGAFLGEALGIEAALQRLGNWLQSKVKTKEAQGNIAEGFVAASLLFCVGTMAILGPLESGLQNQHSILFAKSVLDGIAALVMASTLGVGVLFSAASVFVYQGAITLLAVWVSPYLTPDMLRELTIVGGIMITGLGLNMLNITKIKVGNLLPALFVPVVYYLVLGLFS